MISTVLQIAYYKGSDGTTSGDGRPWKAWMLMIAPTVEGIDLFKIA